MWPELHARATNEEETRMKRFHVHVSVEKLDDSIRFYSTLFGAEPTLLRSDYAKWMLDDPRVNFAISQRDHAVGIDHVGLQVDTADELAAMRSQLDAADTNVIEQNGAACCYARSDKHWVTDPSGIAWETFRSMGEVSMFGEDTRAAAEGSACCIPLAAKPESASCCVAVQPAADQKACYA